MPSPESPPQASKDSSVLRLLRDIVAAVLLAIFVIVFVYRPVKGGGH